MDTVDRWGRTPVDIACLQGWDATAMQAAFGVAANENSTNAADAGDDTNAAGNGREPMLPRYLLQVGAPNHCGAPLGTSRFNTQKPAVDTSPCMWMLPSPPRAILTLWMQRTDPV